MVKYERVAIEGFEDFYNVAVEKKAKLRAELEAEMEAKFATASAKLDKIIGETSEEVEVEVPDEVVVVEEPATAEDETVGE